MAKLKKKKRNTLLIGIFIVASLTLALGVLAALQPRSAEVPDAQSRQMVSIAVTPEGFVPSTITAKPGVPIRLLMDGTQATGCYQYIISKQLGFNKKLQAGQNEILIPAQQEGTYEFGCSMGMIKGSLVVTQDNNAIQESAQKIPHTTTNSAQACGAGCGCAGTERI